MDHYKSWRNATERKLFMISCRRSKSEQTLVSKHAVCFVFIMIGCWNAHIMFLLHSDTDIRVHISRCTMNASVWHSSDFIPTSVYRRARKSSARCRRAPVFLWWEPLPPLVSINRCFVAITAFAPRGQPGCLLPVEHTCPRDIVGPAPALIA